MCLSVCVCVHCVSLGIFSQRRSKNWSLACRSLVDDFLPELVHLSQDLVGLKEEEEEEEEEG